MVGYLSAQVPSAPDNLSYGLIRYGLIRAYGLISARP